MKEKLQGFIEEVSKLQNQAVQRAATESQNVQKLQGYLEAYQNILNLCAEEVETVDSTLNKDVQ